MRYHALIMAAASCVPMIAINYDQKVENLMNELGLEKYNIDLDKMEEGLLLKKPKNY